MDGEKILIITYYWPPSGGSGVQRWLKMAKYLSRQGWEVHVYTPENPSFTVHDESLQKDVPQEVKVIKRPIWEPYKLFFKISSLSGKKKVKQSDFVSTGKKSMLVRTSSWIRGNFFIPDARIFWVKPSVRFLTKYLEEHGIKKIITTGPPHSMHLIGLKLKRKNPSIKWAADFRDPWSEWDLLDTLSLSKNARKIHRKLEHQVLTTADRVMTIAPYHVAQFERLGGRKVDLLTNGFDEEDFRQVEHIKTSKFTIRHIGTVDELRDPRPVMEALVQLVNHDPAFRDNVSVEFIGNVNSAFKQFIAQHSLLKNLVIFVDSVPHDALLKVYGTTDLQLLVLAFTALAPGNLPGKFFEYLASGNPVLAVGPVKGDAADILQQTGAGQIFDHTDIEGLKKALAFYYARWKSGEVGSYGDVSAYTRRKLAQQLAGFLKNM